MTTAVEIPVAGAYQLDPGRSRISFTTRHLLGLGTVRGTFAVLAGQIHVADPVTTSSVDATVAAASVDTGNAARDRTVRSPTYLDTDRHPTFTFTSTGPEPTGDHWLLHGVLTVRAVSHPVELHLEQVKALGDRLHVVATTVVDRYAFGITAMPGMTGRRLSLRLEISANAVTGKRTAAS